MAGFGARTEPARSTHDRLTARAVALGDSTILCLDVCGLDAAFCARLRAGVEGHLVVTALHTHGGPCTTPGRLGGPTDPAYMARLELACLEAVAQARASRRPARVRFAQGADPGIGRNRRRPDGPRDGSLPALRLEDLAGQPIATVLAHACHPVVLGADNLAWTADYPHFTRAAVEQARPGDLCVFLMGCTGDVNTGHSAHASMSTAPAPSRTFAEAERLGRRVADCVLAARMDAIDGPVTAASAELALRLTDGNAQGARASLLHWAGVRIACLPGEPFAATGLALRAALGPATMALGFADGCPGYFPTAQEYALGGYEVREAHRYYGMTAAFAPGSAERLAEAVLALA